MIPDAPGKCVEVVIAKEGPTTCGEVTEDEVSCAGYQVLKEDATSCVLGDDLAEGEVGCAEACCVPFCPQFSSDKKACKAQKDVCRFAGNKLGCVTVLATPEPTASP